MKPWLRPLRALTLTGITTAGITTALITIALWAYPARAQEAHLYWVRFSHPSDLAALAATYDVWEVDHPQSRALLQLSPTDAAALAANHRVSPAPARRPPPTISPSAGQTAGIPGYPCYRTVDETHATLNALAARAPDLARVVTIGSSWDAQNSATRPGDPLTVLVLGNRQQAAPQFRFFLLGAIHARELVTAELALRFAEQLLAHYGHDPQITWLLDHGAVHILPIANPDGRRLAEQGLLWRKNTNTNAACFVSLPGYTYGVDLNRNSSFQWASCPFCSSPDTCSPVYRGPVPGSEPEVQALETYLATLFPSRRPTDLTTPAPADTTGLLISLHSYGRLVMFPWGWSDAPAPNAQGLATLARRLGHDLSGYRVCQAGASSCLYQTDGTTDDWSYGALGIPSFTVELGTTFFQSCADFEQTILQPGLAALHTALRAAPLPYQLPAGPDTHTVTVTPTVVSAGSPVNLTAYADHRRLAPLTGPPELAIAPTPIQAGRVALSAAPWLTTTVTHPLTLTHPLTVTHPLTLTAADADGLAAVLTGTFTTTCLPDGRHTLLAQSEDANSHWGLTAAAFITVTNASPFSLTPSTPIADAPWDTPARHTLLLTHTGQLRATYALTATGPWPVAFLPANQLELASSQAAQIEITITPQKNTAAASATTVITVQDITEPTTCRQTALTTVGRDARTRLMLPWLQSP